MTIRAPFFGLFACLLTAGAPGVQAQSPGGTLERIKQANTIVLGHRETSVPFSYVVGTEPVGYSNDIAMRIVEAIKARIGAPNLVVRQIPINSQNRIPLLINGLYDLECGSTTNSLERQKQVAFSNSFFMYSVRFIVAKDAGLQEFEQLAGKTVAVTAGGTVERLTRTRNEEHKMGMNVVSTKDHGQSFMLVETGRAAAFVMDDPLLYGARAASKQPARWVVAGRPLQIENYACMFRKGDPELKALTDQVISTMQKNGEMRVLFNKWFNSPIPPRNVVLEYPFTRELQQLFDNPNDKPLE